MPRTRSFHLSAGLLILADIETPFAQISPYAATRPPVIGLQGTRPARLARSRLQTLA